MLLRSVAKYTQGIPYTQWIAHAATNFGRSYRVHHAPNYGLRSRVTVQCNMIQQVYLNICIYSTFESLQPLVRATSSPLSNDDRSHCRWIEDTEETPVVDDRLLSLNWVVRAHRSLTRNCRRWQYQGRQLGSREGCFVKNCPKSSGESGVIELIACLQFHHWIVARDECEMQRKMIAAFPRRLQTAE